jgi:hypothetical protein
VESRDLIGIQVKEEISPCATLSRNDKKTVIANPDLSGEAICNLRLNDLIRFFVADLCRSASE